ncbi:MAG TPA: hypothetical protein VM512_09860 [Burkholderiaceae bacterium]|nr:hypothetical protein [Burkholderiaceae bacterium]
MRKLKPLEIFTLTTMMSLGSYADAQEAEEVLPTTSLGKITAHGGPYPVFEIPAWAQMSFNDQLRPVSIPRGTAFIQKPTPRVSAKAIDCAQKYGTNQLKPRWTVAYDAKYFWRHDRNPHNVTFTNSYVWPAGGPWRTIYGNTNPHHVGGPTITVFQAGYYNFEQLFKTLAHEFGHSQGVGNSGPEETRLEKEAVAAWEAYLADGGKKCGGLAR